MVDGRLSVGAGANANNFAMMVVQLTVITVTFFLIPQNKNVPLLALLPTVGIGIYLLLLSGSRTGLLACVLTIGFLLLIIGQMQGKGVSYFVVLLCAMAVALVIMSIITSGDNYLAQRFSIEDIKQYGGSGRLTSIKIALNHVIPEHFLFGVGPSTLSEIEAYQAYVLGAASCHNILISMLTQIGILGTIPHFYLIFRVLIKCYSSMKKEPVFAVPFALIFASLINGIGEIVYLERFFWCVMSIAVIMLNNMRCQNGVMYENK